MQQELTETITVLKIHILKKENLGNREISQQLRTFAALTEDHIKQLTAT